MLLLTLLFLTFVRNSENLIYPAHKRDKYEYGVLNDSGIITKNTKLYSFSRTPSLNP